MANMPLENISTDKAPAAVGPYSQAVVANGFVFASGQIALDPATGQMPDGGVVAQTHQVMRNLKAVLEAAGSSLDKVVKATVYLASIDDFAAMNEVYAEHFGDARPARAAIGVGALPKGAAVEIEAIAVVG